MILEATHTHLYPGNRGKISGLAQIAEIQTGLDCVVAFSDGSAATAIISRYENGWRLKTSTYRTAAGTDVSEERWIIDLEEDGAQVNFRVLNNAHKV